MVRQVLGVDRQGREDKMQDESPLHRLCVVLSLQLVCGEILRALRANRNTTPKGQTLQSSQVSAYVNQKFHVNAKPAIVF